MKTIFRAAALLLFATNLLAIPLLATGAHAAPAPKLSEADKADIARIERYLNDIRTLKTRFSQTNPDGTSASGTIYVQRPGRMRVEYDPPNPVLVVATGVWLIYHDKKLGQVSHLPINSSPAAFLVRDSLEFARDGAILGFERGPKVLRLTVAEKADAGAQKLTLVFADSPLKLEKWMVVDPQGQTTHVSLVEPATGVALDPILFKFSDPTPDKKQRN
jgi:outer membrane lipoprotein-sorting protein